MSREIKFRVWNEELEEMYELRKANHLGSTGIIDSYIGGDKSIWQQYTGLKDKNGVDIYEGDILKLPTFNNLGLFKKAVVTFEDGSFQCDFNLVSKYNVEHIEVIGNIYENPELLEATK